MFVYNRRIQRNPCACQIATERKVRVGGSLAAQEAPEAGKDLSRPDEWGCLRPTPSLRNAAENLVRSVFRHKEEPSKTLRQPRQQPHNLRRTTSRQQAAWRGRYCIPSTTPPNLLAFRSQNLRTETVVCNAHVPCPSPIHRHRRPLLPKQPPMTASLSTKNSGDQGTSPDRPTFRSAQRPVSPFVVAACLSATTPAERTFVPPAGIHDAKASRVRHHPLTHQRVATALPRHRPAPSSAPTEDLPASTQATLPDSRISRYDRQRLGTFAPCRESAPVGHSDHGNVASYTTTFTRPTKDGHREPPRHLDSFLHYCPLHSQ